MPQALSIIPRGKAIKYETLAPHLVKKFRKGIKRASMLSGQTVVRRVRDILGTGVRSGVKYPQLPNRSSAPGEPPRSQSGRLARSATYRAAGPHEFRVIETAPYSEKLEFGNSRIKPRPHLIRAIVKEHRTVRRYLQQGPLKEIRI